MSYRRGTEKGRKEMLGDFRGFGAGKIAKTLPRKMGMGQVLRARF
jgi:hypothetical protein